ncbi:MAG TPA: hypothetical protein VFA70_14935, partial [Dehalococcoidia bacterium]|nr:hypothetical protein [Dehalococcoidia bacterium]
WHLPRPRGDLGVPYQALLPLPDGRIVVTDLAAHRLDVFTSDGRPDGTIGARGELPGQFGQVGGLARGPGGNLYVADQDSRVVQRFTPAGHIAALYWSPEDDEID